MVSFALQTPFGELEALWVHQQHRGKGLGSHILASSVNAIQSASTMAMPAVVGIEVGNIAGIKLHEKVGFQLVEDNRSTWLPFLREGADDSKNYENNSFESL